MPIFVYQNIPFYILFPFMCFKQYKFYDIILDLKFDTRKQQEFGFACNQGGKTSKLKSRKKSVQISLLVLIFTGHIFGKRHDMKQCTTSKIIFEKKLQFGTLLYTILCKSKILDIAT